MRKKEKERKKTQTIRKKEWKMTETSKYPYNNKL